jgi:hypothetical protein
MPSHYNTGEDYLDHEKKKKKNWVLEKIKKKVENKKNVSPVSKITRAAREREKLLKQLNQ